MTAIAPAGSDADPLAASLELAAGQVGDLTPLVYARLYARYPDAEALFLMDKGGHVRGQMLAVALEALLDRGERLDGLIAIERGNHRDLGVSDAMFDDFYPMLMETVREALGPAWTPAMQAAWSAALGRLR
jgi:hemoglobin-like flavoprotein